MTRQRILFAAAVAAAAAILIVTLLIEPGPPAPIAPPPTAQPSDALDLPTTFNPGDAAGGDSGLNRSVLHESGRGEMLLVDPGTDRVTRLSWDHVTPRSHFVYDMDHPRVRVIFSPSRILEVTGDRGQFEINDQAEHIQRGTLAGNVLVRLLETADGSDVDLHSDRDLQLRLTLDREADFDMELGELTSESHVRVAGPRVEFTGFGLLLSYNRLRDRIDRLIIDRNVNLLLRQPPTPEVSRAEVPPQVPRPSPHACDLAPPVPPPATQTPPVPQTPPQVVEASPPDVSLPDASPPQPVQFYRARFERNVVITADQRGTRMTGDHLDAVFTFEGDASTSQPTDRRPRTPRLDKDPSHHDKTDKIKPRRQDPGRPEDSSLAPTPSNQMLEPTGEIRVTCDGRLFMEPITTEESDRLAADPRGALLALVGDNAPADVITAEGEHITAKRIDYLTTTGRLRAEAGDDPATPLRLTAMRLGELTGRSLRIDPDTATGQILGPGTLTTTPPQTPETPEISPSLNASRALRIAWNDRLDLAFFAADRRDGPDQLLAIRTATFRGGAQVTHEDFDLAADVVTAHADRDAQGASQLTGLDAEGNVQARREGLTLHAPQLHATVDPLARQPDETGQPHATPGITTLTADGGVTVVSVEPAATLQGDRLTLDGRTRQLELFGSDAQAASVLRDDAELRGGHLVMNEDAQTVHVVGPGTFKFLQKPEAGPEPTVVTVTWADSMHFDQINAYAHFLGTVASTTETSTDQTRLTCGDLRMDFDRLPSDETAIEAAADEAASMRQVRIRTATAQGNPQLQSRSVDPGDPNVVLTRFTLKKQPQADDLLMTFEGSPTHEQAQVIGRGAMTIEDDRPTDLSTGTAPEAAPEISNPKPQTPNPQSVSVTGRGRTLFTWEKLLKIDTVRNDMILEGDVRMVHLPRGDKPGEFGEPATLACQQLYADLQQSEGLDGWLSDSAPKMAIHLIVANGGVRIEQQRKRAFCDRLTYVGERRVIELAAARGGQVRIEDQDRPVPLSAAGFEWKLDTDTINVKKPGAMTVPLPQ